MQTISLDSEKTPVIRYLVVLADGEEIPFINFKELLWEVLQWRGIPDILASWFFNEYDGPRKNYDDAFADFAWDHIEEALEAQGHKVIKKVVMV